MLTIRISSASLAHTPHVSACVNDVRVGRSLPVARPGLEQPFDLGVVMIFRDREALEKFERDQRREQAIDAMLRPLVRNIRVYNFVNE